MKKWKKILTSAFAAVMIFSLSATPVFAAESGEDITGIIRGEETTYQVTLYAGNGKFLAEEQVKGYIKFSNSAFDYDKNVEYSEDKIIISNLKADDKISVIKDLENPETQVLESIAIPENVDITVINGIEVAGENYYVKGFVNSGETSSDPAEVVDIDIEVTGDADYVVVYGIAGNQVTYTVKYQDKDGKA